MTQPPASPARLDALDALTRIDPVQYGVSRNHLDGAVTGLSAYLRHGVLTLTEVRDAAVAGAGCASSCQMLIKELAWRDYYQRIWRVLGDAIWDDIEPYKTGRRATDYADDLPHDLLTAATGIDYIDHFVTTLHTTGYLHNHARMWLAAYVVHGRRVKWQAGARWFLSHLLDGDEASNNLSWQWCASTFSHKPYIFNRENVRKFSGDRFAAHHPNDPFDADYDVIAAKFFRPLNTTEPQRQRDLRTDLAAPPPIPTVDPTTALVWVHDGMMSPAHPAVALGRAAVFVWDDAHIATQQHSPGRIAFQRHALFCPDIHAGDRPVSAAILDHAHALGCSTIVTGDTPDPRLRRVIQQLQSQISVAVVPEPEFVPLRGTVDLARFSRYWNKAEPLLLANP